MKNFLNLMSIQNSFTTCFGIIGGLLLLSIILIYRYDKNLFFEILGYIACILICIGIIVLIIFLNWDTISHAIFNIL